MGFWCQVENPIFGTILKHIAKTTPFKSNITWKGLSFNQGEWRSYKLIPRLEIESISSKFGFLKGYECDNSTSFVISTNDTFYLQEQRELRKIHKNHYRIGSFDYPKIDKEKRGNFNYLLWISVYFYKN